VILNAIYFKSTWLNRFDEAETKTDLFYPLSGEPPVGCLLMQKEAHLEVLCVSFAISYCPACARGACCS